ncbi:glycoside hydrolase family 3 protein [Allonocardiopsis opalescens]|uniref:Beta-glucosidase n=1 Tax=Allonocardiopsis opalescens TaxID=1144618 RepID=A0A2T0PVC0_9ACTN|nr:glycoside hydrolase family 3 C-terminal domain-containing protein [Allonocardiopsis opalescens]PRX95484.1 beta-glucosidase [Allonocardiopsis opalescens]
MPTNGASDIDETDLRYRVGRLTLEQKVALVTGADFWTLNAVPEIGLDALVLSDGPNGVRGRRWDERDHALLLPCASALAATWDAAAVREAGRLFGAEARRRGVHVLLAPTLNLHRTPLGGRHFENFSEDPLLTAELGAAYIEGVQFEGVAATAKHYVANDSETERMSYDASVAEPTLREVYLAPFEAAVRRAGAWAVMAAYNGVNGAPMTQNEKLLGGVLKGEWGFDGVVMSDWSATHSTEASALAGLDLVMPGPRGPWGEALAAAVEAGRVGIEVVDDKVLRLLRLAARTGALRPLDSPSRAAAPVAEDTLAPPPESVRPAIRELTARSFVLLANRVPTGSAAPLLPLPSTARIALIGENAVKPTPQGGGSAQVSPPHMVTPAYALAEALAAVSPEAAPPTVHRGVRYRRTLDPFEPAELTDPVDGLPGARVEFFDAADRPLLSERRGGGRLLWLGDVPAGTARMSWRSRVRLGGPGRHSFGVLGAGRTRVLLNGSEVHRYEASVDPADQVDLITTPVEERFELAITEADLGADASAELTLVREPVEGHVLFSIGLGHAGPGPSAEEEFAAAVAAARAADAAVVVVGTDDETETEGRDRTGLGLPGRQDELVSAVLAANPRTVVVVNAGGPVLMPWAQEVPALLWTWFGGQEYGAALADVLLGAAEPGGRLPTTLPVEEHDAPVLHARPVAGRLDYGEGTEIGYRAYAARGTEPLFWFGHGLGYTTWAFEEAVLVSADGGTEDLAAIGADPDALGAEPGTLAAHVRLRLHNTGDRAGREVIQVYARPVGGPDEPARLVGFASVHAEAGGFADAEIGVAWRSLARYLPGVGWRLDPEGYTLTVARSAAETVAPALVLDTARVPPP